MGLIEITEGAKMIEKNVCPKCGYVQNQSDECIICGIIYTKYKGTQCVEPNNQNNKETSKVNDWIKKHSIFIITGFFFILVLFYFLFLPVVTKQTNGRGDRGNSTMAYIMMEGFIKRQLKAPKSAKFPRIFDGRENHVKYLGSNRYSIISYVDSQNFFGAMVRNYFIGEIEKIRGDEWRLHSLEFKQRDREN